MKFCLVALTSLVALATVNCHKVPQFGSGPLYEDIQYFMDMIPMNDVKVLTIMYAARDSEFQMLLRYMETNDFKELMKEIEAIPEFHTFAKYLQDKGVNVYNSLNKLNKLVNIPPFKPLFGIDRNTAIDVSITGGLKGYFDDVKSHVDYDLFIHGYVFKMRTSPAFRDFVKQLKSPGHQRFIDTLYKNERYLHFRKMIADRRVDVALIEDIIFTVLGIEFPDLSKHLAFSETLDNTTPLTKDIQDFKNLIDMKKVMQVVSRYLDDDQVQTAMKYMYSEEFHALVRQVEALKEYQDLVLYLYHSGLDIFNFLEKVHKLFGMEDYVPPKVDNYDSFPTTFVNRGGVKGLVNDVIAVIPVDKFKALYNEKMQSSPAFRNFIQRLRDPEYNKIVSTIYKAPVFLEMRRKALAAGIDVEPVKHLFKKVFNIDFPPVPPLF